MPKLAGLTLTGSARQLGLLKLALLAAAIGMITACAPTDEPAASTPDLVYHEAPPPDWDEFGYAVDKGGPRCRGARSRSW